MFGRKFEETRTCNEEHTFLLSKNPKIKSQNERRQLEGSYLDARRVPVAIYRGLPHSPPFMYVQGATELLSNF